MQRPFVVFLFLLSCLTRAQAAPDFNRDVRPILASRCFKCHGMDDKARKADLRFDLRASALEVITPGQPDKSEFIKRLFTHDENEIMPPPAAKIPLTDKEKQTLREWVQNGAPYAPHWAFVKPQMPKVPDVKNAAAIKNPIDKFILARLEQAGLRPSPPADKYSLARRVYLDLIGLPPTPQEADAFVQDKAPNAYEKMVDKLLSSPQYGERWARRWLDLARYADTNGYEKDRNRNIWPYRDWVVRALNDNLPFDQFSIKQLAGDMLPNASTDDKIATGFHRNTMLNEEGGIDPLEFRYLATVDRVATTGTTWLGLTTGCAQCHTHKFDPITHTEYFQLMAFLNNADEPDYEITDDSLKQRLNESKKREAELLAALPGKWPVPTEVNWKIPVAEATTSGGAIVEKRADGILKFTGVTSEKDAYTITLESDNPADRLKLEVLKEGETGPGRTPHGNFVLNEIEITAAPKATPEKSEKVKIARAEADFSQHGFPVADAIDGKPNTGWAIHPDSGAYQSRTATFSFAKPVGFEGGTRWTIKLHQNYGLKHVIGQLRLSLGAAKLPDNRPHEALRREALENRFATWEKEESARAVKWQVVRPTKMQSSSPYLNVQTDGSILAGGDSTKSDVYDLHFEALPKNISALRLEVLPHDSLPSGGPGMVFYEGPKGDFFLSEFHIVADGERVKVKSATQSFPKDSSAQKTQDGDMSSGWSINGAQGQANAAVFVFEKPINAASLDLKMLFERHFSAPLGHFRISVAENPNAEARGHNADIETLLTRPQEQRTEADKSQVFQHFLATAPELSGAMEEIKRLRGARGQSTLVMQERPANHPRPTFLHNRGEWTQPKNEVTPNVPSFLPPLPQEATKNRLNFAQWLFAPENPLTARVTVNRQWNAFFGRGLVKTLDDFGYQGEVPSHPELLDYLALQFQSGALPSVNGKPARPWDMKALHKLIVTSATYKQSAKVTPQLLEKDAENILLARGPRFRLEAEIIRDAALKSSNLLAAKMGGPGVYPPQPEGVTEVAYGNMKWPISQGEDRYRRSLYTYIKRTAPFAMFNSFDAPTGESCLARREVSNTALQALILLNDVMFQEAAQALGRLAVAEARTPSERATFIFRRCLTRLPDKNELTKLVAFADKQQARGLDEQSVWSSVARAIMNLDETVSKS